MQSVDPRVNHDHSGHLSQLANQSEHGVVLPRFLRKPVRHVLRFMNGGFRVSKRGLYFFGGLFALAISAGALLQTNDTKQIISDISLGMGIAIESYEVEGNTEVSDLDVVTALAPDHGTSILSYDVAAARKTLKSNPWIADAVVSKVYPNKLEIKITERVPFAIWQNEHGLYLIDRGGLVLSEFDGRKADLPLVVGKGAEVEAANIIAQLQKVPALAVMAKALVRVGERRWDIETRDGMTIMLPEHDQAMELARFSKFEKETELLMRDIDRVDLRMKDRMVVRLSEDAKELVHEKRDLQIKVLKKSRKARST